MTDFNFARAILAGEMPPSQADTNAQLVRVIGGWLGGGRRRHHAKPATRIRTFSPSVTAHIADAAVIKVGLGTFSLAMVREIQNDT